MSEKIKTSRREFFTRSAQTAALFGLGGVAAQGATRNLSGYRAVKSFSTGAKEVRGVAVGAGDRIYVAADRSVLIFENDGSEIKRLEFDAAPMCVALRKKNNDLLVGLSDHIEVFDDAGRAKETWPLPGSDVSLTSLAVSDGGEVYASDGGQGVVWHLGANGKVLRKIDREGAAFSVPRDFFPVATSGGKLVVANLGRHSVETMTSEGRIVSKWGGRSRDIEGFGGCCNPVSIAVTPDGSYVTAEGGLPRIKVFDANGKFVEQVAGPEELESNARASHETTPGLSDACQSGGLEVAVDSASRIVVLDRVTAEVKVFAQA